MFDKIRSIKENKEDVVKTRFFHLVVDQDKKKFSFTDFIELAGEHDLELIGGALRKVHESEVLEFELTGTKRNLIDFDYDLDEMIEGKTKQDEEDEED